MNIFTKNIRKLMGWCPNAKTAETECQITPANFEAYNQPGNEKARNPKVLNQFSKLFSRLDVRIILQTILSAPVWMIILFIKGVNIETFLLGLSLSLLICLLFWNKQMLQYNNMTKNPIIHSSKKKTLLWIVPALILFLISFTVLLPYFPPEILDKLYILNSPLIFSFLAGFWTLMLGTYFQLIYWKRKNHMKIYTISENGFQKTYALGEKE